MASSHSPHKQQHPKHPKRAPSSTAIAPAPKPGELDKKKRPLWLSFLKWFAISVAVRELYIAFGPRRQNKRDVFNLALQRAQQTGKPLLVIGDPDSGLINRFIGRDYDCGSLCLDQSGCLSCAKYEAGPLEDLLPAIGTNSHVVFVNSRLERVADIDKVLSELERVSNSDLFVVASEPYTLTSMFWGLPRRQIFEAPPRDPRVRWKPLPWRSAKSTNTVLELPNAPLAKR